MDITENQQVVQSIRQAIDHTQFQIMASTLGLTESEAQQLFQPADFQRISLDEGARSEEEIMQSTALVYIMLFVIYFTVLIYGNMVAMEVAKEKSSRVMEILISSVNPIYQMFGKILGISLLGILQIAIFISIGVVSVLLGAETMGYGFLSIDLSELPFSTVFAAVIFFILGYLFYATIAAMLGSLISRVEELNTILLPMTLMIVAAFMIAMFGLTQPNATFVVITSFIPLFIPMIMFLRVGVGDPALWEVLLGSGLLVASIILVAFLAARVYKGGVLMYGKEAKLKDITKAISIHKNTPS